MIKPSIHLNGSGADNLFEQYANGAGAIRLAMSKIPVPHPRDYYVQGEGAFEEARKEYEAQIEVLKRIENELRNICEHIADERDQ